jgi:hypothetical protein
MPWSPVWNQIVLFLIGVATGTAMTWWRWKASLEILDRSTEWRTAATEIATETRSQKAYIEKLDETVGRLADFVRVQIKVTTPEHLRGAVAKMVGETPQEKPQSGWDTPIPPFRETTLPGSRRKDPVPRGL